MLLFNPVLRKTFDELPIESVLFLYKLFDVEWDEDFHNSNEKAYDYLVGKIKSSCYDVQTFSACLLMADTLLVKP